MNNYLKGKQLNKIEKDKASKDGLLIAHELVDFAKLVIKIAVSKGISQNIDSQMSQLEEQFSSLAENRLIRSLPVPSTVEHALKKAMR